MRAVMLMFDSLNRHMLPPYGCDWVHAPNFQRLAERTTTFRNSFVASMPCMPARRELHTGRCNFLHRSWGPVEPFDDSMPELLQTSGVYTHLVTDHYHYWEEGGCTYHTRYGSHRFSRGQEGDAWMPESFIREAPADFNPHRDRGGMTRQDYVNRKYMDDESRQPQAKTVAMGLEFLEAHKDAQDWFLHIETFDPHEPFFTQEHYKQLYPHDYDGPTYDWPPYRRVTEEDRAVVDHVRSEYAALVSMCDAHLGKVLDFMDAHDMWQDTMLIVNTDHGFLLGEHDWWAKCRMPFYNEIAHSPLFIWDPRSGAAGAAGETRDALVQTIDLAPTLLDFFGREIPEHMLGKPLAQTIVDDTPVREAGIFGLFGAHVNVTDGRYVYMRAPATADNTPLFEYTLMPTHMRHAFGVGELQDIQLAEPFGFTKGCRTMKIASRGKPTSDPPRTMLFDLESDYEQNTPLDDPAAEQRMIELLVKVMKENDAPAEQYERLGLTP